MARTQQPLMNLHGNYFLNCLGMIVAMIFWCSSCSKTMQTTIPRVTTDPVSEIAQTTATSGGNVTSGGGLTVTARGVCWSITPGPTTAANKTVDSSGTGTFTSHLAGLTPNTIYYVRAYATNSAGTAYGAEMTFTTLPGGGGTVTDIDGNLYHTISIGTQVWMVENLKVTRFNKGDSIPEVTDDNEWSTLKKGAYCNYDKDPANATTYGRLYNWYVVGDTRNVCPSGWHVPTDTEWQILIDHLGGAIIAGGKLKATGTLETGSGLWHSPNTGATNESGFSAVPGGFRNLNGSFTNISSNACYWSSTADQTKAWEREMSYKYGNVDRYAENKENGYSIRCLKDQ